MQNLSLNTLPVAIPFACAIMLTVHPSKLHSLAEHERPTVVALGPGRRAVMSCSAVSWYAPALHRLLKRYLSN